MKEMKEIPQKKPREIKNDPYGCDDTDTVRIQSCSSTDCTGLIPSLPQSDAELEAYEELYPFEPPEGEV